MSAIQTRKWAAAWACAAAATTLACPPCLGQVTIIDLGALPSQNPRSEAYGMNDNGQVVGEASNASGQGEAFLWDSGVGITGLGFLGGGGSGPSSRALGINDLGQVVGWSTNASGRTEAFLWESGLGMAGLGFLSAISFSAADGINDFSQVVGWSVNASGQIEAFLWESGVGITGLGSLSASSPFSIAEGINDLSQVVGRSENVSGQIEAFLWESGVGMTGLGFLGGSSPLSWAHGINNVSQIVGESTNASGRTEAFLWKSGVGMTGLGFLGGGGSSGPLSTALGVNDLGQVVGRSRTGSIFAEAFLWENGVGMINLNSLLPPGSGWSLTLATDINNNGEIVGTGVLNRKVRAFLLRLETNEPPSCAGDPGPFMVNVGEAFSTTITADDPDGDELTVAAAGVPLGATVSPATGTAPFGITFSWTPTIADLGQHSVSIKVTDSAGETSTCGFEVAVVDLPPDCDPHSGAFVVNIGDTFSYALVGHDDDPGDVLTVTSTGLPAGATLAPASGASPLQVNVGWEPTVNDVGQHDVTVTFTDLGGESETCVFSIFVANRPPSCSPHDEHFRLTIGDPFSLTVTGQDDDPGDVLAVSHGTLPPGAALSVSGLSPADAVLQWTPSVLDVGLYQVNITFTDLNLGQATCTLLVEVVNRPPGCELEVDEELFPLDPEGEITPSMVHGVIVTVGQTFTATFTGDDGDPGDVLTVSASGLPPGSTLTPPSASGAAPLAAVFEWAPTAADVAGNPHVVEVTYRDLYGDPALCILEILVNRPPVAVCAASELVVECTSSEGADVTLDGTGSFDPDDDTISFKWDVSDLDVVLDDDESPTPTGTFAIGVTMATLTVADGRGGVSTCDVLVTVQDTTPPEVMCTTDAAALWPPKHDMRSVTLVVTTSDACENPDPMIIPLIVTVRSDEPDNAPGVGDGNTTGDVNGQDGYGAAVNVTSLFTFDASVGEDGAWVATILLRAEREGTGDGRAYTIDVQAFDTFFNIATTSCVIVVPHDRRPMAGS